MLKRLLLAIPLWFGVFALGGFTEARASIADAPPENLQIALVTYGPGETYWERFGHDAIEVRDSASGEAVDFNYGVFDFNESNFFVNFARGRMHYLMDAELSAPEQASYAQDGRSVNLQHLALTPLQAASLRDFLLWNLRPENAGYSYDYYADNCTTRVRDALDHALGGLLKAQLAPRAGGMTYRQQTARLMSAQPWLMLLMDLGLGPYADQPLSAWQESFLPMVLQAQFSTLRIDNGHGGTQPMVQNDQLVSANRLEVPPANAPDLRLPLAAAGVLFAALLLLAWRSKPAAYALLCTIYLVLAGTVGVFLLALWTLTTHHSAWANANLFIFNPVAFFFIASAWRARRGLATTRLMEGLVLLQLLAMLIALLLHLLHGVVQQNQPWLLFALPCWLALAWTLRQSARQQ